MNELEAMEDEHVICGYHTLIDWDKVGVEKVMAMIEVRVTPQRGLGFDKVAERIYNYPFKVTHSVMKQLQTIGIKCSEVVLTYDDVRDNIENFYNLLKINHY